MKKKQILCRRLFDGQLRNWHLNVFFCFRIRYSFHWLQKVKRFSARLKKKIVCVTREKKTSQPIPASISTATIAKTDSGKVRATECHHSICFRPFFRRCFTDWGNFLNKLAQQNRTTNAAFFSPFFDFLEFDFHTRFCFFFIEFYEAKVCIMLRAFPKRIQFFFRFK